MSAFADISFPMSPAEYRLIRDDLYAYSGIRFGADLLRIVSRRLAERLRALELESFLDYHRYLLYAPDAQSELERAIELLTTNETYFFREEYQLTAFRDEILPEIAARAGSRQRLTVWSAGCSTGEEAYTIAIMTMESPVMRGWDVRIFGCDISRRVIAQARAGIYSGSSFRATDPKYRQIYFQRVDESRWEVHSKVRELVTFGHMNLLDPDRTALMDQLDVVFCRNVMIYFDRAARRRLIKTLYDKLKPGGYLLLGHAESLLTLSTAFELCHLKNDLVYRRPLLTPNADGHEEA